MNQMQTKLASVLLKSNVVSIFPDQEIKTTNP